MEQALQQAISEMMTSFALIIWVIIFSAVLLAGLAKEIIVGMFGDAMDSMVQKKIATKAETTLGN